MSEIDDFLGLVDGLCRRRHMYVPGGTFYEVCAYLSGYASATPKTPISGEGRAAFNSFVCATFGYPGKYSWPYVIKQSTHDDDEATERLAALLAEFAEMARTISADEMVRRVASRRRPEGEPERAWRLFSRAIHRARREEIEPLIQEHPDAGVLWSASYPEGVAPLLDAIQESFTISVISGSDDLGEVTIITPDFGPVHVKRIGGELAGRCLEGHRVLEEEPRRLPRVAHLGRRKIAWCEPLTNRTVPTVIQRVTSTPQAHRVD